MPAITKQRRLKQALSVEDKKLLLAVEAQMRAIYRQAMPLQARAPDDISASPM